MSKPSAGRSFGEEGGLLTYGRYLRVPELLAQQVPEVSPPVHDELLFIIVHQTYELWFKQLLHELTAVRDAMLAGGEPRNGPARPTWLARHLLHRVHVIERLLVAQIDVLETMTPQDRPRYDDLWELAEDLLAYDELAALWRARHVQMVERQIGTKSGTGGSTGAPYLHRRVPLRYYPLLWELRDSL
jgi:tryptophan 2,3-dioxygenase